jgi:hypothetical protein
MRNTLEWSGSEFSPEEPPSRYDTLHQEVGKVGRAALSALSTDVNSIEADRHGWTIADVDSLRHLATVDELAALMVPPAPTSFEDRTHAIGLLRFMHNALPLGEAERWWLLSDVLRDTRRLAAKPRDEDYLDPVRLADENIMIDGKYRLVSGRDLLQRFWSWRRETGEYAGGDGLDQARKSLADLVELLTPELGLPEEYQALRLSKPHES